MLQSVVVRKIDYDIDSANSSWLVMSPVLINIVKVGPAIPFGVVYGECRRNAGADAHSSISGILAIRIPDHFPTPKKRVPQP
jgi:hypothetical protein